MNRLLPALVVALAWSSSAPANGIRCAVLGGVAEESPASPPASPDPVNIPSADASTNRTPNPPSDRALPVKSDEARQDSPETGRPLRVRRFMDRVRGHAFDIHDAVLKGDVERIKALLAEDPDRINTKNPDGAQALLCAVGYQPPKHTPEPVYVRPASPDPAIVKLLLSAGADPNARDMRQRTALHYAAIFNARAIAEALVAGHADVDADGSEHETPLHIATVAGFTNMMSLLLDHAANVDATNHEGATPLLSAVGYESSMTANISYVRPQNTDPAVVKLLLDRGANPNVFGLSRGTPLHYAAQFDLPAIAQLLVGAKADVNARDGRGETPLHRATASGHLAVAELLLASGADPSLADDNRWTPLSTAANRNDQAMVDLLRRHGAK